MNCVTPEALSERIRSLEKMLEVRITGLEDGIKLAKENNDFRLEGMNEFRNQLTQQAAEFLRKNEYIIEHKNLLSKIEVMDHRIQAVENLKANIYGRMVATGGAVAAIMIVVQILIHVFYVGK